MNSSLQETVGTFAVPRFYLAQGRPEYPAVRKLFNQIQWPQNKPRSDFIDNRFNAFCTILWAVRTDQHHIMHTILNKAHYNESDWPIPYLAMKDVVQVMKSLRWLVQYGERQLHRNFRYQAPSSSPLLTLKIKEIKLSELYWEPPLVSVRRGVSDLERAPLDVEVMAAPRWKALLAKHLIPPMEELNDKLLMHEFVLFPYGKANYDVQPQYQRIYTNVAGFKEEPLLLHGRIYPQNFFLPGKKDGWRQMTLIDSQPTVEVDVHASSLTLLANDHQYGFKLPNVEDYYQHGVLNDLNRDTVKMVVQMLINGVSSDRKTWPKSARENAKVADLINTDNWQKYAKPLVQTYPVLSSLPKDMGMRLMLKESTIIIKAMNYLLDQDIGCLSVHDCLIVPKKNVAEAIKAFEYAYGSDVTNLPRLSLSS